MSIKKFGIGTTLLSLTVFSTNSVFADNYGCEALLCFAGGMNVSECQPTINRVLRDLARGKGFPHCSFVNSKGIQSSQDDFISVNMYREKWNYKQKCRDGKTNSYRVVSQNYCRTIQVNVKPDYALDKEHQTQYYNY